MTCDQAIRLVEKLADGEAKPSERTEAETHLESCADCRSHYQFVRALESASEKIDWPEPPETYWSHLPSKVLTRLERERPAKRGSFWQKLLAPPVLRFGAVAATLSVVVAVGYSVLQNDQLQPEPEMAQSARSPASAGQRQVDDKAAGVSPRPALAGGVSPKPALGAGVADDPGFESQPPAALPSLSVDPASVEPDESGRVESARRTADLEGPTELTNAAGLAGRGADQEFQDRPAAAPPRRRENRALRSLAEAPGEPVEATVATEEATTAELAPIDASVELARKEAPARAQSSVADRCAEWRDYLARNGDEGSDSLEARYQVALCSLERYTSEPSGEARATAERDVEAFLAMESDGDRADDVRARAERLRR